MANRSLRLVACDYTIHNNGPCIDIKYLGASSYVILNEKRVVFSIVANMGSIKRGAVDPLGDVAALRKNII